MLLCYLLSAGLQSDVRFPASSSSVPNHSHTDSLARENFLMPYSYGSKTLLARAPAKPIVTLLTIVTLSGSSQRVQRPFKWHKGGWL